MRSHTRLTTLGLMATLVFLTGCYWGRGGYGGHDHQDQRQGGEHHDGDRHDGDHHDESDHR